MRVSAQRDVCDLFPPLPFSVTASQGEPPTPVSVSAYSSFRGVGRAVVLLWLDSGCACRAARKLQKCSSSGRRAESLFDRSMFFQLDEFVLPAG